MEPNGPNVPMTEINNEISTMRKVETVKNVLAVGYVLGDLDCIWTCNGVEQRPGLPFQEDRAHWAVEMRRRG